MGGLGGSGGGGGGLAYANAKGERTCQHIVFNRYVTFVFVCMINLITYYDRGAIAALLLTLQDEFHLSTTEGGLLGSVFMLGFMIASPIFAQFIHSVRPTYLLSIGLAGWTGAALFSGFSHSYAQLLVARSLIGVGEASFCGISPTMVDDIAPPKQRTIWLAIFFAAIPVGAACGFLGAGLITKHAHLSWRWVFFTEAIGMAPFMLGILFVPYLRTSAVKELAVGSEAAEAQPLLRSGPGSIQERTPLVLGETPGAVSDASAEPAANGASSEPSSFCADVAVVFSNTVWLTTCVGYGAYTFVLGGLSFWAPTYLQKQMGMTLDEATFYIGAITVFCGLVGTFAGGALVDTIAGRTVGSKGLVGSALQLKWCVLYSMFVTPLGLVAFGSSNKWVFFGCLAGAQLFMFAVTGPVNAALLSCVPEYYRTLSMAMSIFVLHSLGDMPSPVVIGAVIHWTGSYRRTMLMLMLWFILAIVFWSLAWLLARTRAARAAKAAPTVLAVKRIEQSQ